MGKGTETSAKGRVLMGMLSSRAVRAGFIGIGPGPGEGPGECGCGCGCGCECVAIVVSGLGDG